MSLEGEVVNTLKRFQDGFKSGRLGHAYLIVGDPRGNGAQLAESILRMLFCGQSNPPCGACNNCRRVANHIHPDVVWIEPIKKSRGILVEQIEGVIRNIFETTFEGGWKAVVLVSAERMNNEAANKLLKTLEEPPPRSIFLLLTDQPEALLPTIISRCQRVALSDCLTETEGELRSAVVKIAVGLGSGRIAAKLFQAREMIALLKSIRDQAEKETAEWLELNQVGDEQADDIEKISQGRTEAIYRERRKEALRLLLLWQRDVLLCASGLGADDLFFFRSESPQIRAAAAGLTGSRAMNNINIVENMQAHLDQHLSEFMVIERSFLKLSARSDALVPTRLVPKLQSESESGRGERQSEESERAGGKEGNVSFATC